MATDLTPSGPAAGRSGDRSEQRDPRTRETPTQRWNRHYLEILHETRAAQVGTQLLLVFLLTLAFTSRFDETTRFQRAVYVVSLVLVAGATCLLIAPAPFHRLVFRRRLEAQLVRASSRFAFWGVTLLMLAVNGVLLLILDVVMGTSYALPITAGTLLWFLTWWYLAPGWTRLGQRRRRKEATIAALEAASEKLRSERVHSERINGGGLARALDASVPVSAPALAGRDRVLPGPHPPQLRPGPTWPAPRLPMMPTPHPPQASSDQLGYPGGRVPAVGYDRPSSQPGPAAGPSGRYLPPSGAPGRPDHRGPYGSAASVPAPVSGPVGGINAGAGDPTGAGGPTGPYAAIDPLGPLALGGGPAPYTAPFDGAAARGPQGPAGPRGRHHGISVTDLPVAYTTGDVPRLQWGDGMQHGRSGGGMQNGRADDGVTQFGVPLPLGPTPTGLPTGLPAPGGEAAPPAGPPTPTGAAGPATAGPAVAGPAPVGPTDTGSIPVLADDMVPATDGGLDDPGRDGVVGRARVTPPTGSAPRHAPYGPTSGQL